MYEAPRMFRIKLSSVTSFQLAKPAQSILPVHKFRRLQSTPQRTCCTLGNKRLLFGL